MSEQIYKKIGNIGEIKRNTDLVEFLAARGIKPVSIKKNYALFHAPYRQDRNPSCIVYRDKNVFVDMATGEKGDIFKLVQLMYNCSFSEAVQKLSSDIILPVPIINESRKEHTEKIKILKVKSLSSGPLKKYIISRGISFHIANRYCKEIIFEIDDRKYYSIGFRNDTGGYELRNEFFKGCSAKDVTTIAELRDSKNYIVFEGFFDYLSYKQLNNKPVNSIVMNSVNNLDKTLSVLKDLSVQKVFVCSDADKAGERVFNKIKEVYKENAVDLSGYYKQKNCKDLNELLMLKKTLI